LHSEDVREYQIQGEKVTCQPWLLGGLSGACWLNLWCATLSDSHLVREAKISPCTTINPIFVMGERRCFVSNMGQLNINFPDKLVDECVQN
jgi:hypothetical protein